MNESNNRKTTPGADKCGYPGRSSNGDERGAGKRSASGRTGAGGSAGARSASSGRSGEGRSPASRQGAGRTSGADRRGNQSSADRILAVQNARNLGSGTGKTPSGGGSYGNRKRGRRRRQGPDAAKILLIVIGAVILLICVGVGVKSCSKGGGTAGTAKAETTTEPETELAAEITVNGISVNGLTKSAAKEKVMESIGWGMKVSYNGEIKDLPDMMGSKVDAVLDEAYSKQEAAEYTVTADGLGDHVKALVEQMASGWDVPAKNGAISSYDKENDQFVFSNEESGKVIDRDKLTADIMAALSAGDYKKTVAATAKEQAPEITKEQAKAQFKRLGTFTTTTTANKDRNENIRLASSALNGIILQPGEEFSMNSATGARTTEKGYKPAGAYLNGVLIEEPGGGVCQVSSTLYNAVVFSGLRTTERHPHSFEPSYVTPGEDAMISFGSADMKFVNNSKSAVAIKTSFSNQKLTMSIYGVPVLGEGESYEMKSERIKQLDPPKPEYEEDQTLELGIEKIVKEAVFGSQWVTNLVKKKDGQVVSDEFLHNSTYLGKPATIKRNTSGSVLTTEGATTASSSGEESSSAAPESSSASAAETQPTAPENQKPGAGGEYGPGYQSSEPSGVRPSEEPGANIRPSSPADMATAATTASPGPVSIPQTAPQTQTQAATQDPAGVISPNPANPS